MPELQADLLLQVEVVMDTSLADEFEEVASIPLKSLPYGSPGQTFVLLAKPEGAVALGKFGNVLKFKVKEVSAPCARKVTIL